MNESSVPTAPERARVMIIEDQTAIRHMLATFIENMPGFTTVAQTDSVEEGLRLAEEHKPHIVVLDWMLPGGLGLEFLQRVRIEPPPYVLVFSANTTDLAVREALGAGARGYIEKTASFSEFTLALRAVAEGRAFFGPAIARAMRRLIESPVRVRSNTELSPREREVLRAVAEGFSSKEIANRLGLSVRTVENHRASIIRRTGLRSPAQLTMHAVRLGLIEAPAAGVKTPDGGLV